MKQIEQIIQSAPKEMQSILKSAYNYNSSFNLSKDQEKLLFRILFAMSIVDRKFFVEEDSYIDTAIGIGRDQTISQPSTVARMIILADLKEDDRVLEVGTGSGWNSCLISLLVYPGSVLSIERFADLAEKAKKNLKQIKNELRNSHPEDIEKMKITIKAVNLFDFKSKSNFDKIMITAGIKSNEHEKKIQDAAKRFLKNNGILICPRVHGSIIIFEKKDGKIKRHETSESYVFVPLEEGTE